VSVGDVESARQEVDASGQIVCPGFIDVHSHVDAQICWDPALTPYCLHGTTSTFAGNCGFTLAPWDDDSADYLVRMLSVGEGIPVPSRSATSEELVALAGACQSFDGTSLEFIPNGIHPFDDDELELLAGMSRAARRPLNWNVLRINARNPDHVAGMLRAGPY